MKTCKRCKRCKGKGYVLYETYVVLNWPVLHFIMDIFNFKVFEKKLGKVMSPEKCHQCGGTGRE